MWSFLEEWLNLSLKFSTRNREFLFLTRLVSANQYPSYCFQCPVITYFDVINMTKITMIVLNKKFDILIRWD